MGKLITIKIPIIDIFYNPNESKYHSIDTESLYLSAIEVFMRAKENKNWFYIFEYLENPTNIINININIEKIEKDSVFSDASSLFVYKIGNFIKSLTVKERVLLQRSIKNSKLRDNIVDNMYKIFGTSSTIGGAISHIISGFESIPLAIGNFQYNCFDFKYFLNVTFEITETEDENFDDENSFCNLLHAIKTVTITNIVYSIYTIAINILYAATKNSPYAVSDFAINLNPNRVHSLSFSYKFYSVYLFFIYNRFCNEDIKNKTIEVEKYLETEILNFIESKDIIINTNFSLLLSI